MCAKPFDNVSAQPISIDSLAARLMASPNVCDQRKGRDLARLQQLSTGVWRGSFTLQAAAPLGEHRVIALAGRLGVQSLAWNGQEPYPHDRWTVLIGLEHHYPLAMPQVRFVGEPIPYNPHVMHRDHVPDEATIPAELRHFLVQLREGYDGGCCYMASAQWETSPEFDLAMVLWQVSRILTGVRIHGEQAALNNHARDSYLRLADQGRLPLGPALPVPSAATVAPAEQQADPVEEDGIMEWQAHDGEESEDIEWIEGKIRRDMSV